MGNMNVIRTCYIHHVASEDTEVSIECTLHNLTVRSYAISDAAGDW